MPWGSEEDPHCQEEFRRAEEEEELEEDSQLSLGGSGKISAFPQSGSRDDPK